LEISQENSDGVLPAPEKTVQLGQVFTGEFGLVVLSRLAGQNRELFILSVYTLTSSFGEIFT
jgi:hypothetical protein